MKTKMKYLFSLQLFGGPSGDVKTSEKSDLDPGNDFYDFRIGNNVFNIPLDVFKQIKGNNKGADTKVAAVLAAYYMSTGKMPTYTRQAKPMYLDLAPVKQGEAYRKYIEDLNKWEQSRQDVLRELQEWYKEETGGLTLTIDSDSTGVLLDMIEGGSKFGSYLESYMASGVIKINGQEYDVWAKTQPQLQPGYDKALGVPVAQTTTGEYVYKNKDGSYVLASGDALPEGVSLVNSVTGKSIQLGADGLLYDTETGELIKGFNESLPSAREQAENDYYRDLFSREEGTLGADILANSTSLFEKEAANAQLVADTSMQQQALAQAQGIKQVTDSLRNERMSQLRAGMSESQLADRELNMLMSSVDAFNTQAQQSAQDSLTAQLGANTAREQAFNEYLTHAAQLGQTSAAMSASDAGSVNAVATQYFQSMQAAGTPVTMQQAWDYASGLTLAKTTGGN